MNKLKSLFIILSLALFSYSILAAEIDLLGLTLDVKESGIDGDNVNITIEIYDAATIRGLIYNSKESFTDNTININEVNDER